jgi:hypothetical protein
MASHATNITQCDGRPSGRGTSAASLANRQRPSPSKSPLFIRPILQGEPVQEPARCLLLYYQEEIFPTKLSQFWAPSIVLALTSNTTFRAHTVSVFRRNLLNWAQQIELVSVSGHQPKSVMLSADGQSASLFWCQATIWDPRPILLFFCLEIIFRQLWDCLWNALSDDRTSL